MGDGIRQGVITMRVPIRRPSRRVAVLSALPAIVAAGAAAAGAADAATGTNALASPCTTFLLPQYTTVGADCSVHQGDIGVGGGAVTYPGPGAQVDGDVTDQDDVYGAGVSTSGTHVTVVVCDGPWPYYCTTTRLT